MKLSLILIALGLLACFLLLGLGSDAPVVLKASDRPEGPSFEVRVVKPLSARPLFGLLPAGHFGLPPSELRFDHRSPGADVGSVGQDHLELRATGWDLVIKTDAEGRIAPETRLVLPVELAERQLTLRCRPPARSSGHLHTTARAGSEALDGSFLVKLATCENIATGKVIPWPPRPLTVSGSFEGLQQSSPN